MQTFARCGCDASVASFKVLDVTRHPGIGTVTVSVRAVCCGKMFADEVLERELHKLTPPEREL